mmetsp:Transcript_28097/g.68145  ORF Transcript_28097/g.68145 Transcript_28097/m.68145 type:complete len:207 (+) Transcript_28097:682-1302(+)
MSIGVPAATLSPRATLVSTTTPGIGAPTLPGTPDTALGLCTLLAFAVRSAMITDRGVPLKVKKTSRVASFGLSIPMASREIPIVLPFSSSTCSSSPSSIGSMNARVGSLLMSPKVSTSTLNCSKTLGYMTHDIKSVSEVCSPYLAFREAIAASKSRGGSSAPGRPEKTGRAFTICCCNGCGNPPKGMPIAPWKYSTTEEGKESESA